ncbi:hypothetical protein Trydic_g14843 [Trypoxylus dichotomus]
MAFRIGHQITCNIKKNPILRSLSVDSSHRLKSLSYAAFNNKTNSNFCCVVKDRKVHVTRARSLPLPENCSSPRWFSCRSCIGREYDDSQYTESISKSAARSTSESRSASTVNPVLVGDKSKLLELQPSNITPIAHNQINHDILYRNRSATTRALKIRELKRMAQIQYEKAVRSFVSQDKDENCRYQLESSQPKDCSTHRLYSHFKKKIETEAAKAHQLQPRNIKPYGKLNTIPWIGPNVESRKQSIVAQNKRRSRYESIFEKRKRLSPVSNRASPRSRRQRDYSTAANNKSPSSIYTQQSNYSTTTTNPSPDLEKCKAIIAEYKKLNPNYVESSVKVTAGSNEEKQIIERTEKLISSIKKEQPSNDLQNNNFGTVSGSEHSNVSASATVAKKANAEIAQKILDSSIRNQPKVQIPSPTTEKVVLYYEENDRTKSLCSKIVKDKDSGNSSLNDSLCDISNNVNVKVGPKLMLQSSDLNDRQYTTEELKPAPNEKFVAPWLSWSDRVKQHIKNKMEMRPESPLTQLNSAGEGLRRKGASSPIITNTVANNSITNLPQMQKRQFSRSPLTSQVSKMYNSLLQEPKLFSHGEKIKSVEIGGKSKDYLGEILPKITAEKMPLPLSQRGSRVFSTNSTRGVLGPEGTVMVKLRRLPKINIPEPDKGCRDLYKEECIRADDLNPIQSKKLPRLGVNVTTLPSKKKFMDAPPLVRPKRRNEPVEPAKICPKSTVDCEEQVRADGKLKVSPRRLPKIRACTYTPAVERKMIDVPLRRLKPRPLAPPPPCRDLEEEKCILALRADHGLETKRKNLPSLKASSCSPKTTKFVATEVPLKRLSKVDISEPTKPCASIVEECAPRADEIFGYKIKRKKLQSLILGERYNNLSWREFNKAKKEAQVRTYSTDSKCNMCCYSEKTVHPDIKEDDVNISNHWDKFNGRLFCEEDGKLKAYLPPEILIDNSTGSELKIIRKPIGALYRKDEHLHEELLKNGFTNIINKGDRKFSSYRPPCNIPPSKPPYKDLKLKPLKKRSGFEKDFPARIRFQKSIMEVECSGDPCADVERMDTVLKYEVKAKKLPPIPKGNCDPRPKRIYKDSPKLVRRLKKRFKFKSYDCPKEECKNDCPPRADDGRIEKFKRLPPLRSISGCAQPKRSVVSDNDRMKLRRLPPIPPMDRIPCPPSCDCEEPEKYRADFMVRSSDERKQLPPLVPKDCLPKSKPKMTAVRMRRLPKPPFMDRIDDCKTPCEVQSIERADRLVNYQTRSKKLKALLKSNNKAFSTLPNTFLYDKNFSQFENYRSFSSTSTLQTADKKCKKLVQHKTARKCPKINPPDTRCKAKSISCAKKRPKYIPCTKTKTPYPSFSECKDHHHPDIITECAESDRHLQPRWPILSEIKNQKPPPPYQGKIDPSKQEECIARKLNILLEGETKSCETFGSPDKLRLTKEMYDEVIKNPPFKEGECAEDKKPPPPKTETKGPCPPVEKPICPDPEIECVLPQVKSEGMACSGKGSAGPEQSAGSTESAVSAEATGSAKATGSAGSAGATESDRLTGATESGRLTGATSLDEKPKLICQKKEKSSKDDTGKAEEDSCKPSTANQQKPSEETKKCEELELQECQSKKDDSSSKKKSKTEKAGKKKGTKKGGKDKKAYCRNVKKCGTGKSKRKGSKNGKKGTSKKCSDILKEEDEKAKKKGKMQKGRKKKGSQMADLCKQRKPCTSKKGKPPKKGKLPKKASVHPAVLAAKCPPKKSLWQRILDFFKARPNCPPPDQWKKEKLKKKAQKAAAAAGLELCEKKKPTVVSVTCKKPGIKDSNLGKKSKKAKPIKKKAEKSKNKEKCELIKPDCKKSSTKEDASKSRKECKKIKWECSTIEKPPEKPGGKPTHKPESDCKPEKPEGHKVAEVAKEKECDPESEKNCIQEEEVDRDDEGKGQGKGLKKSGKCKVLPRQKFCKPRARTNCKDKMVKQECTTTESPYPSFSECKKHFPKLPTTECSEQEKNIKRRTISHDYDNPDKQARQYSTYFVQKRFYANNAGNGKKLDPLALLNLHEEYLKNMKDNELASKILAAVKEGMNAAAKPDSNIARQRYYDIFKELEMLCEQELNETVSDDSIFGVKNKKPKINNLLPNTNLSYSKSLAIQKNFPDVEQTMTMDAIKNFCKTVFSLPNLSTEEYEETEKLKTERLQRKLDELLDNYKMK